MWPPTLAPNVGISQDPPSHVFFSAVAASYPLLKQGDGGRGGETERGEGRAREENNWGEEQGCKNTWVRTLIAVRVDGEVEREEDKRGNELGVPVHV